MSGWNQAIPELHGRTWRALWLLTGSVATRLLREGMVLRSLISPTALGFGTLIATLGLFSALTARPPIAVPADLDPALAQALESQGWPLRQSADFEAQVRAGNAWAGTDGRVLWTRGPSQGALEIEGIVREHLGASWRPVAADSLPEASDHSHMGLAIAGILTILFTLYGTVFGLGAVARDRDDGTLEAELSLPIPHWVPAMARWLASTALLSAFLGLAILLADTLMGLPDVRTTLRHGAASCGAASAIGLMVVGRAGLKQGFAGPLAAAMTLVTGGLGLGIALPSLGQALPLASVFAGGTGWGPLGSAVGMGLVSAAVFSFRSARS